MEAAVPVTVAFVALVLLGLGAVLDDRRARVKRREQAVGFDVETVLPLLHSINDDRCIGCEACVDVCPTEVLDLVNHKVRVARFSDCVQCEQCANACPTTALVMYREGTTPRMLTVPELDDNFQTGVPGQYLIGEVAGKPLVKNAANLGRAVIEHIKVELANEARPAGDVVDVVIVGSGPAGLSAGLTCLRRGLSVVVLEKEHVISSTVSRYPKGKHFMAEPADAQNMSFLPVFDATKEELVAAWERVVAGVKLPVKLGEAVETVKRGDDGVFAIKTTVATYRARRVVLATGLRGKPRLLAVPGANLEKVHSLLDDPAEFARQHVLVVGGGDSAVEGAMALAQVGATVTLSYRGDGFKRCKQGNQKRLAEMTASGELTVLLESNVKEFTAREVTIKLQDGSATTIPNDHAFVLIGADTPVVWLEANNVRFIERPHLYALGSSEDVVRRVAPDAEPCTKVPDEAIAIVLGQQPHKKRHRVREVVGSIATELHDIRTSVSVAFRLSDLENNAAVKRAKLRTPTHGTPLFDASDVQSGLALLDANRDARTGTHPALPARPATTPPATRAKTRAGSIALPLPAHQRERPSTTGMSRFLDGDTNTVTTYSPFGKSTSERTAIGGRALRPKVRRVDPEIDRALENAFDAVAPRTVTGVATLTGANPDTGVTDPTGGVVKPPRLPNPPRAAKPAPARRGDGPNPFEDERTRQRPR